MKQEVNENPNLNDGGFYSRFVNYGVYLFNKKNAGSIRNGRYPKNASEKLTELSTEDITHEMLESLGCYNTNLS